MPGHFVEEAGRVCLGLPVHSSGVPRPSQLHSAQQAQGPSHQLIVTASELLHVNLNINWDVSNLYLFYIYIFTPMFSSQVRKAAQQGVCSILRGSDFLFTDNAPTHHPAAVTTAKFCMKEMEQAGGKATYIPICNYMFFFLCICFCTELSITPDFNSILIHKVSVQFPI